MWQKDAQDKAAFVPTRVPSDISLSDRYSDLTEWAAQPDSAGSPTVHNFALPRSRTLSTNASCGSLNSDAESASSPIGAVYRDGSGLTPPDSPKAVTAHALRPSQMNGYELCAGCIEFHGIAHAKAATELANAVMGRKRKDRELRHAFREKIWGSDGWKDIGELEHSVMSKMQLLLTETKSTLRMGVVRFVELCCLVIATCVCLAPDAAGHVNLDDR